jgi:hypothetical protein
MPNIQLQFRRDTSSNWILNNPSLAPGEMGIETDTYKFKIGIGTTWLLTPYGGLQGIQGSTGLQGIQGPQGVQGVQGIQGIQGIQGLQGSTGIQGSAGQSFTLLGSYSDITAFNSAKTSGALNSYKSVGNAFILLSDGSLMTWSATLNDWFDAGDIKGPQGNQGIQGITGSQGIQGIQGPQGITGPQGLQGIQGIQGITGSQGIQGIQGPQGVTGSQGGTGTLRSGNVLTVDAVYGNDSTASPGGSPYLTIQAANSAAVSGQTISVLPGTYTLTSGITLTPGICLKGFNIQTCKIQMINVTANTTLITMGENCRIQDLTLSLTSVQHHTLVGIEFPGTTTQTSKFRYCVLTVDNSTATSNGISNVYGILCSGTGSLNEATFSLNCLKGSTINCKSNGGGNKRGVLITGSNQVSSRDMNIYVASPSGNTGSYVGVETAHIGGTGSIQLRSTSIGAPKQIPGISSSDILQTYPSVIINPTYLASAGIQVGPGTDLVTKSAGGKPFTTYTYPTTLYYGIRGMITNTRSGWLWLGTQFFSNSTPKYPDTSLPPARYRVQQPLIISGMMIAASNSSVGDTTTITVCKNASTNTPNGVTSMVLHLTGTNTSASYYNSSVDCIPGDYISIYFTTNSITIEDVNIQIDMF